MNEISSIHVNPFKSSLFSNCDFSFSSELWVHGSVAMEDILKFFRRYPPNNCVDKGFKGYNFEPGFYNPFKKNCYGWSSEIML